MRIYKPESTRPIPPGAKVNEKARTVTYTGRDGERVRAVLTDSGKMRVTQRLWHISFRDGEDRQRDIAAFEDEGDSRLLADKIKDLVRYRGVALPADLQGYCDSLIPRVAEALRECGLLTKQPVVLSTPLTEFIGMYEQALLARERSSVHIRETVTMLKEAFETCGLGVWRDIKDDKIANFLRDLREGERHVSYRRSNAYLTACVSFCNWIVNDRKWADISPLRGMTKLNVKEDPRHTRRALDVDQLRTLLQKTAEGPYRYGMSGRERYLLYRLAVETGLRAGELRRLRRADFNLDAGTVTVRAARATKNKKTREQPLRPGLCAELRDFLASKLPDAKAFGGSYAALTSQTATMLQEDLAEAGIPYKDDQGNVFDFHALRVECASLLIDSGVDPKQAQEIMRHSTIGLTMDVYAKVLGNKKKAQAVASLPDLSLPQSQSLAKTGTDDASEIYGEIYAQDTSDKTASANIGQMKADGVQITALAT